LWVVGRPLLQYEIVSFFLAFGVKRGDVDGRWMRGRSGVSRERIISKRRGKGDGVFILFFSWLDE